MQFIVSCSSIRTFSFSYFKAMELQRVARLNQLLLLLLLCLSQQLLPISTRSILEESRGNDLLVANLGRKLNLIMTSTCVAHNMSIFLSTDFYDQLPEEEQSVVERTLGYVKARLDRHQPVPLVMGHHMENTLRLEVELVVIFVQNSSQLERANTNTSDFLATHRPKYLIVLFHNCAHATNATSEMSQIFAYFHRRYIIDVLILLVDMMRTSVEGYTFWPYRITHHNIVKCGCTQPLFIPLLHANLLQLFPPKVNNLHGCPLRVIVWNFAPFIKLHTDDESTIKDISGVDADLLKIMAKQLNFTLELVWNEPRDLVSGTSYGNGTLTGVYRMLYEKRGNLSLGGSAGLLARSKYLSSTLPYRQLQYGVILRWGSPFSLYEIFFCPYRPNTWPLLLAMFIVLRLVFKWQHCFLMRPVLVGWVFLFHVLQIGYESSVFKYVHNPPVRQLPQTLEEAIAKNYNFIMDYATYRLIKFYPEFRERARVLPGHPNNVLDHLLSQPMDTRTAAFTNYMFLNDYLAQHNDKRQMFVMQPHRTLTNMICIYLPRNSYMTEVMDKQVLNIRSAGIDKKTIMHLRWDNSHKNYDQKLNGDNTFQESTLFIYAAFNALIFCDLLAVCVFILELISRRYCCLKRCLTRL